MDGVINKIRPATKLNTIASVSLNAAGVATRKLDMLNYAVQLLDLRSPSGNRLEPLKGDLAGFHSIRINDQWRVIFRWTDSGPRDVQIVDYHR